MKRKIITIGFTSLCFFLITMFLGTQVSGKSISINFAYGETASTSSLFNHSSDPVFYSIIDFSLGCTQDIPKPQNDGNHSKDQIVEEKESEDKVDQDKGKKTEVDKNQAARDKAARDKAARDKAARDKAARDKAAKDEAANDKAAKDKAAKANVALENEADGKTAEEQDAEDRIAKNQETIEKTNRQNSELINSLNEEIGTLKIENAELKNKLPSGLESVFINMWTLLVMTIGCLILGFLYYLSKGEKKKIIYEYHNFQRNAEQIRLEAAGAKVRLQKELAESKKMNGNVSSSEDDIRKLNLRIKELEEELKQKDQQVPKKPENIQQQPLPPPPPPPQRVKYATYPDDPDGFSSSSVKDKMDTRTIYEFKMINENTASVRITNNPEAQKYALGNSPHLLGNACEYSNSPNDGNRIVTVKDGKVSKSDNVWKIVERVSIRFE